MNLEAGSSPNLRKLVLKRNVNENVMLNILEATTTDSFEEIWVEETWQDIDDPILLDEHCLDSIKRVNFLGISSWNAEYVHNSLTRMPVLEENELCFGAAGQSSMDYFLCRLIQTKEAGRLPHLNLLKLMKFKWHYVHKKETSTCSTPMALLLLLWLHDEANGCARGLHVPFIPLTRGHILLRMLQLTRGDEGGKAARRWKEW